MRNRFASRNKNQQMCSFQSASKCFPVWTAKWNKEPQVMSMPHRQNPLQFQIVKKSESEQRHYFFDQTSNQLMQNCRNRWKIKKRQESWRRSWCILNSFIVLFLCCLFDSNCYDCNNKAIFLLWESMNRIQTCCDDSRLLCIILIRWLFFETLWKLTRCF